MNVATKFDIDPLGGLSRNARKPESVRDGQTEGREPIPNSSLPPTHPRTLLPRDKNPYMAPQYCDVGIYNWIM